MSEESPEPRLENSGIKGSIGPNEESEGSPSQISHLSESEPSTGACRKDETPSTVEVLYPFRNLYVYGR